MSEEQQQQAPLIVSEEQGLERLEEETLALEASPHHGLTDAIKVNRLRDQMEDLETQLLHDRERRCRGVNAILAVRCRRFRVQEQKRTALDNCASEDVLLPGV